METRIKELREQLGLSRSQFCAMVGGISLNLLKQYELQEVEPRLTRIQMIAEKFGVNPSWLAGWSESMFPEEPKEEPAQRQPPYFTTDACGRAIAWKETKRPFIGRRK